MYGKIKEHLSQTLAEIREAGLYKEERLIESPQRAAIEVAGKEVLNFCANNYLGLSDNKRIIEASKKMMDERGFGMSSVRFICGTQDIHKQLEKAISEYFKTEDTILYAACFDANGGVFEPLLTDEDAIISDALNHASIIDGVRLCKAKRYRYANADMADLERCLQEAQEQRFRIIVTDGVFSMDGNVAPMDKICDLAEKYDALVMVDESHSAGVVGKTGHGVSEFFNTYGRVDIYTGTLGKAFGGALGGFTTGRKEIIDMLRQRSRPYLFSNSLAPCIIGANTEVRHCAFIRGSALVGENCVIGNSVELKNVIIFDNVQTPHYNYVGDSILGYKSHMGAGSITSNVKSDKTNVVIKSGGEIMETGIKKIGAMLGDLVEVGCNSVLNPGTIIGRNCNIYPTSCVRGVVPEGSIWKTGGVIVKKK